jgi:hypothetical protein
MSLPNLVRLLGRSAAIAGFSVAAKLPSLPDCSPQQSCGGS